MLKVPFEKYPNIEKWMNEIKKIPEVNEALKKSKAVADKILPAMMKAKI